MLGKSFNLQLGVTCVNIETHSSSAEFLHFLLSIILMHTRDISVHRNTVYFVIAIRKHRSMEKKSYG
jgi:hypothetical protein